MDILCIDAEPQLLRQATELCKTLSPGANVVGFSSDAEALLWLQTHKTTKRISARTFGEFDLFVNGRAVTFSRSKAKELLAYLIDRQGGGIKRATAAAVLWEDALYDRAMQKQLDVVIRSLRTTLAAVGAADILEIKNGILRILPEKIHCDLYCFLGGEPAAVKAYRGEYMSAYSWANMTEAFLTRMQNRMK